MSQEKVFQGIDTVIVRVSDVEAAKKWYQTKLGFAPEWVDPAAKLVVLHTGSPTSLTLWQTESAGSRNSETAAFPILKTTDARAAWEQLKNGQVHVAELVEGEQVRFFRFYDPDGNVLEACQVLN